MNNLIEWDGDFLQRRKYALFLTNYLENKNTSEVININGPWGSGKTFFLQKWFDDIKETHPAVYFNAWQNDYSNEPLISLISCLISHLISLDDNIKHKQASKNFLKKSGDIIRKLSPTIVKGILKKYIGENGLSELSKIGEETEDTLTDLSSELTEALIKSHEQTTAVIEDFKKSISSLLDELTKSKNLKKPLFIFIDELDRCRPIFAIDLLEKIKHIFDIDNVIFVIATDTTQLSHSVKAIYGHEFNGEIYLRRFFDQIYTLPKPDSVSFITMLFSDYKQIANYFQYRVNASGGSHHHGKNTKTLVCLQNTNSEKILIFSLFSNSFGLDLRTCKQCFERFKAIESSFLDKTVDVHFDFLIFLIMLDAKYPSHFEKFFSDRNNQDILNEIGSAKYNIRVYTNYYTAAELINIYIQNLFISHEEVRNYLNSLDYDSNEFKINLISSLITNFKSILQYQNIVKMANALE
ncbi:KAP family NTPase [Methylicorpusculum oleiharenae]|uniref:KAP family P-loop NTPase fold protein n=1 Tax=Methylicorpusculum oleiharenae TaxID=1338687 RepID=UPI001356A3D8|nr:P-loop NTPase fold protein [Methylicorpusculum oleiharenae]MCD2451506.1 KAP family NTPase [Methylicorpusculum oleiharenae]